ncbi:MAG: hypothetical protein H7039_15360 [Bryobacteraceae bacterium]|nr:hypothetical protein [Bryobacteraceae bacterium]
MNCFYRFAMVVTLASGAAALGQSSPPATGGASSPKVQVELYPAGQEQSRQNPVVLSFAGRLYTAAVFTNSTGRMPVEMGPDEAILPKIISDNASADLGRILTNWNPPEREEIAKLAGNPEMAEANANSYKRILQSELLVKMLYGANYVVYMVRHNRSDTSYVKDYPFKRVEGKLYLTNELTGDPVFQYITTSYAQSLRGSRKDKASPDKP